MTTERAIELLNRISDSQFDGIHGDERREALDMAVRALFSQQTVNDSQELVNDCISRKAVMKEFADFVRKSNNSDFAPTPTWNDAVSLVGSIPSVQPQACDDAISRDDAIMAVKTGALSAATIFGRTDEGATAYYETVKAIKALPSAQPHWIPCSERLPKYPFRVQIQLDNGWIITGYYAEKHWYTVPHCGGFLRNDEVEAWRKLPEPYGGEENG